MALRPTIVCFVYSIYDWPEWQKPYTYEDTNIFYSDCKTDLKLRCNCIWYSLFGSAQDVFSSLTAVYYMLVPTTPRDYPSTTRDRSVDPPVAVNINIFGYLQIFLALLLPEL